MVEYGLRPFFRIAAWFPGLLFLAGAIVSVVEAYRSLSSGPWNSLLIVAFGLLLSLVAWFFLRIGWTGRVPAYVEEYGLDGPGEVENSRDEARRQGRLHE